MKEKLLCVGLMTLLLVGCEVPKTKPQRTNEFSTISSCTKLDDNFYQIVKDNGTGLEYVVVTNSHGVGITRRYK